MNRFRKLKGLKKVVIEGDLEEAYATGLLGYMEKPPIDFTSSIQPRLVVPGSNCSACWEPDEDYLQVEDKPYKALSRSIHVDILDHVFNRRTCDPLCPDSDLSY